MPRFTILEHRLVAGVHWDLLFEIPGGELRTFQVAESPVRRRIQPARRLADHRRVYLGYRGPVLLNRGSVRPAVQGVFDAFCDRPERFCARIIAAGLAGILEFDAGMTVPSHDPRQSSPDAVSAVGVEWRMRFDSRSLPH